MEKNYITHVKDDVVLVRVRWIMWKHQNHPIITY